MSGASLPTTLASRCASLYELLGGAAARFRDPTTYDAWGMKHRSELMAVLEPEPGRAGIQQRRCVDRKIDRVKAYSAVVALCAWMVTKHAALPPGVSMAMFDRFETLCRLLVAETAMTATCEALGVEVSDVVWAWSVHDRKAELLTMSNAILPACGFDEDVLFGGDLVAKGGAAG